MSTPSLPRYAAAYIRVSTDDQVELSPDSQLEEIRKYAQREGLLLLAIPLEEGGPFPLEALFCLARVERVAGQLCAVFAFRGEEPEAPVL